MAAKNHYPKQDRLKYIRRETPRVCTKCDKGDQCEESSHRKKVVERWICEICREELISKAGAIRHMQEQHERQPRTHTKSGPRIVCECGEEFLAMHKYYDHCNSVHPRGKGGVKKRQSKEGEEPEPKRAKKRVCKEEEFKDLLAKIKAQLQSKD